MIDPYEYVRAVTVGMATIWTVGGVLRMWRFTRRWRRRMAVAGMSRAWTRRMLRTMVLRITVFDPVNLGLMLVLLLLWTVRRLA